MLSSLPDFQQRPVSMLNPESFLKSNGWEGSTALLKDSEGRFSERSGSLEIASASVVFRSVTPHNPMFMGVSITNNAVCSNDDHHTAGLNLPSISRGYLLLMPLQ
jgi:hypothetical protein